MRKENISARVYNNSKRTKTYTFSICANAKRGDKDRQKKKDREERK